MLLRKTCDRIFRSRLLQRYSAAASTGAATSAENDLFATGSTKQEW